MKIITVFLRKKLVNLLPTYIFFNEMDSYKTLPVPPFYCYIEYIHTVYILSPLCSMV